MAELMYLRELVLKFAGWSYAALWTAPDNTTEQLLFAGGTFVANPLIKYETSYWNAEALFKEAYKTCCFPRGSGYVGKALAGNRPLWLNGTEKLSLSWSNTSKQSQFFKVAGIQTVLCVPWFNSVVELGSSIHELSNANLIAQIHTFLSQMPTSNGTEQQQQQQVIIRSHPFSQALSNGSDDASFNNGAVHDQQVDSGPSFPLSQSMYVAAIAADVVHEKHMSGSPESNWASNFTSARTFEQQQRDLESPQSATSPLQMQQQHLQSQQEGWMEGASGFDESAFLVSPRTQLPLLSQLNYNQSISSSLSSSKSDNDDHNTDSNGNQRSSLEQLYLGSSNGSPGTGMTSSQGGFEPWSSAAHRHLAGVQRKKSRANQALLQRAISMTRGIPPQNAGVNNQRQSSMGPQRQTSSGLQSPDITTSYGARSNDMSVHDEAALHHMMAERKRRQKQKENFAALRALIPFVSKMDRASILEDAIRYVKELSSRVEELQTCNRELEAQIPLSQRKRSKSSNSL